MRLHLFAFRRGHAGDLETVTCIFKAFVLLVGQCFKSHGVACAAAPFHVGGRISDFVGDFFDG